MKKNQILKELFGYNGLNVPLAVELLRENLQASKENYSLIKGLMDRESRTKEEIKMLQLELLIRSIEQD